MNKKILFLLSVLLPLSIIPFSFVNAQNSETVLFYGFGDHAFAFTSLPDNPDLSIVLWNYKSSTFGSFEELIIRDALTPGLSVTITDCEEYKDLVLEMNPSAEIFQVNDDAIEMWSFLGFCVFVLNEPVCTDSFGTIKPFMITFRPIFRSRIEQSEIVKTTLSGYTITNRFWLRDARANVVSLQRPLCYWPTTDSGVGYATRKITQTS